jgi:hypothetical protein
MIFVWVDGTVSLSQELADTAEKSNPKPEAIKWLRGFLGVLEFFQSYVREH